MSDILDRIEAGAQTIGQAIGFDPIEPEQPKGPFTPAALSHAPAFPAPGIYFGMPDEHYHAIPALSSTGVKKLAASPMIFWASHEWLNQELADQRAAETEEDKEHRRLGKAYHARLLEGADAYAARFGVALNKADYPGVLESTDDIKGALLKLGATPWAKVETGETVPDPKKDGEVKALTRAAKKEDWIRQLHELDASAQVWAVMQAQHAARHAGKLFITADQHKRIEIAARMIERDDELRRALSGGHAEVSLFWYCQRTGVPMKARADYLKIKAIVDLKSFGNTQERSIERAIAREIANYSYNIQPSVYFEGAAEVRRVVRAQGASAVHTFGADQADPEQVAWAVRWAQHEQPDEWLWIFQQKGPAPVTRGCWYPRLGITKMISDGIVSTQKRRFREFSEAFGTDPWLDIVPVYDLADEDIPSWSTEI